MEFSISESNINRKLTSNESIVYRVFQNIKNDLLKGLINESQACMEKDFYTHKPERILRRIKVTNGLVVDIYINFSKGDLSILAEADANHKKRDVKFHEKISSLNDRFIGMSKEFARMGNGSYYVFDTLIERVVYKEDD